MIQVEKSQRLAEHVGRKRTISLNLRPLKKNKHLVACQCRVYILRSCLVSSSTCPSFSKNPSWGLAVVLDDMFFWGVQWVIAPRSKVSVWKPIGQWSFLVPSIGGRYHIIHQLAVYTTYIPLIYILYIANWAIIYHLPPTKGTRNSYWIGLVLGSFQIRHSGNPLQHSRDGQLRGTHHLGGRCWEALGVGFQVCVQQNPNNPWDWYISLHLP